MRNLQSALKAVWTRAINKSAAFKRRLSGMLRPKDFLLRSTDRRYKGIWISDAPSLLAQSDLKEGDILFGGNLKRNVITHTTSSPLSHCGVLITIDGQSKVFEALRSGVQTNSIEHFMQRYSYVSVFNFPSLPRGHLDRARCFALCCLNTPTRYAKFKAVLLPILEYVHQRRHWYYLSTPDLRTLPRSVRKTHYFCSELVLDFFREAGISGLDKAYYRSSVWTPGMLVEDNIFTFVGYLASSYEAINPNDPILCGCGHLLQRWEKARLVGDVRTLQSFTHSLEAHVAASAAEFKRVGSQDTHSKAGRRVRKGRPWR